MVTNKSDATRQGKAHHAAVEVFNGVGAPNHYPPHPYSLKVVGLLRPTYRSTFFTQTTSNQGVLNAYR